MTIALAPGADPRAVQQVLARLGLWTRRLADGGGEVLLEVLPHSARVPVEAVRAVPGVRNVFVPDSPHPRVDAHPGVVRAGGVAIGGNHPPVLMAGPCAAETEEQVHRLAAAVARAGARVLRGGAFKPRTGPYSFAGHGRRALRWLAEAAREQGLALVTEVMEVSTVDAVAEAADILQVGSRNMQNFPLLHAVGRAGKPVLLKRGMAATIEEWLQAAEHCLAHGAPAVLPCERGIRGWDRGTRNLLDLGAVALLAGVRGLPVIVDPSHAAGRRDLVVPLARAALAAGAAGLLVEVHDDPSRALSDGPQAIEPGLLASILRPGGATPPPRPARPARPLAP